MSAKRLKPRPLVIADDEGFENTDMFGLSEYGERLADLVCDVEDPLVTILDGPWGSGKTVFTKQWTGLMRNRGARVIYFDAFGNDHYADARIPLTAQILSALKDEKGAKKKVKKFKAAALEIVKGILPDAAMLLIQASTDSVFGGILSKGAGLIIKQTIGARIKAASKANDIFQNFRTALEEISAIPDKQPLLFIVDELDRCRPTFAINLIERAKHLFSVPGVQFLLVAHLPQLEDAVRHCYGLRENGRAKIYLEKFYDVKMAIPEDQTNSSADKYFQYLWEELEIDSDIDTDISRFKFGCFDYIAKLKRISFRTTEKILANIALAYSVVPHDTDLHKDFLIEGLCIIRHLDPELYDRICSDIDIDLNTLGSVLKNHLQMSEDVVTIGAEADIINWLFDMWKQIANFFELDKLQGLILLGNELRSVGSWMEGRWTYYGGIASRRYMSPKIIHFARVINGIGIE